MAADAFIGNVGLVRFSVLRTSFDWIDDSQHLNLKPRHCRALSSHGLLRPEWHPNFTLGKSLTDLTIWKSTSPLEMLPGMFAQNQSLKRLIFLETELINFQRGVFDGLTQLEELIFVGEKMTRCRKVSF